MDARLLIATAATPHPDGTISMLRSGIDKVWAKEAPVQFEGVLVARIRAERSEVGRHEFSIKCVDEDGNEVGLEEIKGEFQVPKGGGTANLILKLQVRFPR